MESGGSVIGGGGDCEGVSPVDGAISVEPSPLEIFDENCPLDSVRAVGLVETNKIFQVKSESGEIGAHVTFKGYEGPSYLFPCSVSFLSCNNILLFTNVLSDANIL